MIMNPSKMYRLVCLSLVILSLVNVPAIYGLQECGSGFATSSGDGQFVGPDRKWERMAEWTIESKKEYADPFNEVEVDVVFEHGGRSWRVPTFWRGGNKWTVRFAPPVPGEYRYHYESTDRANPDLNDHQGLINITGYTGDNPLFKHGMVEISANGWRLPYAAGVPGEFRIIYLPYSRFARYSPVPAVLKLEPGIPYHAYYWDPVLGVKVDLGTVEAASGTSEGKINAEYLNRKLYDDNGLYRGELSNSGWDEYGSHQNIHGDTYEPERTPTMGDWVLVLEAVDQ